MALWVIASMQSTIIPQIQPSAQRAFIDHGWLQTYHSFSFAEYFDVNNLHWGALRVFNDDTIQPAQGFGRHPHRDMEILTYVLEGELTHRDSMGNIGTVKPGGIQYLSAGTGITHSEYNASPTTACRLVQMWVLPQAEGLAPRYGQVDFLPSQRYNQWLIVASGRADSTASIAIWQDAQLSVARLDEHTLPLRLAAERYGFLFVAQGQLRVEGGGVVEVLQQGDAMRLSGPNDLQLHGNAELVYWDVPWHQ